MADSALIAGFALAFILPFFAMAAYTVLEIRNAD